MSTLLVCVGSKNAAKIKSVSDTLSDYTLFTDPGFVVVGMSTKSDISDQPTSLQEMTQGAINRAKNCFSGADYSIGLESGIFAVPHTKSGWMDACICAIYDGKQIHMGMSAAFEFPKKMIEYLFEHNTEITVAAKEMGFTKKDNIGANEGMIGLLTENHLSRKAQCQQSIVTSMLHLQNPDLY